MVKSPIIVRRMSVTGNSMFLWETRFALMKEVKRRPKRQFCLTNVNSLCGEKSYHRLTYGINGENIVFLLKIRLCSDEHRNVQFS